MTGRIGGGRAVPGLMALLLLGNLSACDSAAAGGTSDRAVALVARGMEVYQEQRCGACHALERAGTTGIFGPPHDSLAALAERRIHDPGYHGDATTPEDYIRESIVNPGAFRVPGFERTHFSMPVYSELSAEDLDALVFMLSRKRE